MGCHLCVYSPNQAVRNPLVIGSTTGAVGLCERCYSLACQLHGSRAAATMELRYRCADCISVRDLIYSLGGGGGGPDEGGPDEGGAGGGGSGGTSGQQGPDTGGGGGAAAMAADSAENSSGRGMPSTLGRLRAALPFLWPHASILGGAFDPDRLVEAARLVVTDVRTNDPVALGRALAVRIQADIDWDDSDLLLGLLGIVDEPDVVIDADSRPFLLAAAAGRVSGLADELSRDAEALSRGLVGADNTLAADEVDSDLAAAAVGMALAAHGLGGEAPEAPSAIPGLLHLPALCIELLYAYADGDGLGPQLAALLEPTVPSGDVSDIKAGLTRFAIA